MNSVQLLGRLTADPIEFKTQQNSVVRFTLAVDRRKRKDGLIDADFIPILTFGTTAQFALKWLRKGSKIALSGRIQTGKYQNGNGQTVYTVDIIAENIEFAESPNGGQQQ